MRKTIIKLAIINLSLGINLPVQGVMPVHLLVTGQVELQRFGQGIFQQIKALAQLNHNDVLQISESGNAKILCANLKLSPTLQQGTITVKEVCSSQPSRTRENGNFIIAPRQPKDINPAIPYVISPRKTALLTPRPTFKWNAVPGATYYDVKLIGLGTVWKTRTDQTAIVYDGETPLKPDMNYSLIIESSNGQSSSLDRSTANGISFSMVSDAKRKEIDQSLENLQKEGLDLEIQTLAIAHFYQSENLNAEAIKMLENLQEKQTVGAEVYLKLGELYEVINLNSLAKEQYGKAWKTIKDKPEEMEKKAMIQMGLATTNWGAGETEKAIFWFSQAKENYAQLEMLKQVQQIEKTIEELQ